MSTFLVSLGVILVAVVFVTWLALPRDGQRDDKRATARRPTRRGHPKNPAPVRNRPSQPVPQRASRPAVIYVQAGRVRAGLALSVLATFVGVAVALTIAGAIILVAQGLRTTVR